MRILAIRGQNVASLADQFTIDFSVEPLRSAGLFAITGETGAGKSSILDAMCLALYGKCPRLSAEGSDDDVPDTSGKVIKSTDARSCLRRGATQGGAEVDYVGIDGITYRASWTARRARGRSTGTLQAVTRDLKQVESGQVVESQNLLVNAAVERTTGFTYDEFRRTVLLAQGDFDAFLRADVNSRAGLLEKITGTSIYREISGRVFQRNALAQESVNQLEARRGEHRLKSDQERTAIEAESAQLSAETASDDVVRQDLDRCIGIWDRLAAAQRHLQDAKVAATVATSGVAAVAEKRAFLEQLEKVEPLRTLYERVGERALELAQAEVTTLEAQRHSAEAEAVSATFAGAFAVAERKLADEEAAFKAFGPEWDRAGQLDAQVMTAGQEVAAAAERVAAAEATHTDASLEAEALQKREGKARSRYTTAEKECARLGLLRPLVERWDEVVQKLDAREQLHGNLATLIAAIGRSGVETARFEARLADLQGADLADQQARALLVTEVERLDEALSAWDADAVENRSGQLAILGGLIVDLSKSAREHDVAQAERKKAEARWAAASTALENAANKERLASGESVAASATAQTLTTPVARAEAAISETAKALRLRLVPGESCPVCGSTEHPVHADSALLELAKELRADLEQALANRAAADEAIVAAKGDAAVAEAAIGEAQESGLRFIEAATQSAQRYSEIYVTAQEIVGSLGLPLDLPLEANGAAVALRKEEEFVRAQLISSKQATEEIVTIRRDRADRSAQRDKLTSAIEQRVPVREKASGELAAASQTLALARQEQVATQGLLSSGRDELAPLLSPARLPVATLDRDPVAGRANLLMQVGAWRTATDAFVASERELQRLVPQAAAAAAKAGNADAALGSSRKERIARQAKLDQLLSDRTPLLSGEATETHRSRVNAQRLAAQEAKALAAQALEKARTNSAATKSTFEAASKNRKNTLVHLEQAVTMRTAALERLGLEEKAAAALLDEPPENVAAFRSLIAAADLAVVQAINMAAARKADLAAVQADGLPEKAREALAIELGVVDLRQNERRERIGAIGAILRADDEIRATLSGLDAAIASAKKDAEVWAAVNVAIGSSNGDKFSRFAQGITLDFLVALANQRLAELRPRYRLARADGALALHVIDSDMGDEVRSTRSLSGGERFLVSLSLALALSGLGGRRSLASTLFIDEGFGSLDSDSLEAALEALEALQSQGRTVGVISHVEALKDRIAVQIRVSKQGGGRSKVSVIAPETWH